MTLTVRFLDFLPQPPDRVVEIGVRIAAELMLDRFQIFAFLPSIV
jgi:hypothetical protein